MTNRVSITLTQNEIKLLNRKADEMGESMSAMAKIILVTYLMGQERKYV